MKSMMLMDFVTLRKTIAQLTIVVLVVGISCGFGTSSIMAAAVAMISSTMFSCAIHSFSVDAMPGWERSKSMLPFSRKEIVGGRYLFLFVISMLSVVVVSVAVILFTLADEALGYGASGGLLVSIWEILATALVAYAFMSVVLSLAMPLFYKMGLTRGSMLFPAFLIALFVGVPVILQKVCGVTFDPLVETVYGLGGSMEGMMFVVLVVCAVVAAFYLFSYGISCRVYLRRDL